MKASRPAPWTASGWALTSSEVEFSFVIVTSEPCWSPISRTHFFGSATMHEDFPEICTFRLSFSCLTSMKTTYLTLS